jgi:RND family efflux transporter MFP subunit
MNRNLAIAVLAIGLAAVAATPVALRAAPEGAAETFVEETFTQPAMTIELASAVGGIIKPVKVDEGSRVSAGDIVIQLDNSTEDVAARAAQLAAEDKSEEESARVTMEQAQDEAKIIKQLAKEGAEAELLYHQKQLAADVARYKYEVAKKMRQRAALELEAAKIALQRRTIRAPVAGIITRMPKHAGEAVQLLETVGQMAVTDTLHVLIHPPARLLGTFKVGQTLAIEMLEPKRETVTAKVQIVNEVVESASNTFRVRLAIDNAAGALRAGVKVRITVAGPESLKGP